MSSSDNVEPDVIFGLSDDADKGLEPEPTYPGSTTEPTTATATASASGGGGFRINKQQLLQAVDLSSLAYATTIDDVKQRADALGIPLEIPRIIESNGSECLVGVLDGVAVVCWRGTQTGKDLYAMASDVSTDLTGRSVNLQQGLGLPQEAPAEMQGVVHMGFCKYIGKIYGEVKSFVMAQRALGREFMVLGHSLGAAAAILFSYKMYIEDSQVRPTRVYAVGAPKGFESFGTVYEEAIRVVTIITKQDMVSYADPVYWGHRGFKVVLEMDGSSYDILDPNQQPAHIPGDPDAQYEYMRLRQQSNHLATADEMHTHAESDAANYDSTLTNAYQMAQKLAERITTRSIGLTVTTGTVTGHLLPAYKTAILGAIPDDLTSVPWDGNYVPKPWFPRFTRDQNHVTLTRDEFFAQAHDKYVRNRAEPPRPKHSWHAVTATLAILKRLEAKPNPTDHEKELMASMRGKFGAYRQDYGERFDDEYRSVFGTTEPPREKPTETPTGRPLASATPPLGPAQGGQGGQAAAILNALTPDTPIMGYVFYPAESENEIAYNLVAY